MKVRIITTASGWIDGQGWSYEGSVIANEIEEIDGIDKIADRLKTLATDLEIEPCDLRDGADVRYTVKYYAEDDEELEHVLGEASIWQSDINERYN